MAEENPEARYGLPWPFSGEARKAEEDRARRHFAKVGPGGDDLAREIAFTFLYPGVSDFLKQEFWRRRSIVSRVLYRCGQKCHRLADRWR